jgi:hypothetical protein
VWTKNFKSSASVEDVVQELEDDVEMTVEGGASGAKAPADEDEDPFEKQMRLRYESPVRDSTVQRYDSHRLSINWRSG